FAGPALIAVAQPLTLCAPASSNTVWLAPLVKLGASLTEVTVMSKLCVGLWSTPPLAVPPLSVSRSVIVAEPNAFAAGVSVTVPVGHPAGPALNSAALVLLAIPTQPASAPSSGPALIAVAQPVTICAPASSSTVWFAPLVKLGASLIPVTVMS